MYIPNHTLVDKKKTLEMWINIKPTRRKEEERLFIQVHELFFLQFNIIFMFSFLNIGRVSQQVMQDILMTI